LVCVLLFHVIHSSPLFLSLRARSPIQLHLFGAGLPQVR
jgi:hypothetical protein